MTQATKTEKAVEKTASERYEELKAKNFETFLRNSFSAEALKGIDLFEVKTPSGQKFKCRRVDNNYFRDSGTLPLSIAASSAMFDESVTSRQVFEKMNKAEKVEAIHTTAQMIRYICVEPRLIVGEVNGHRNAISTTQLTLGDFNVLAKWAQDSAEGGDEALGLKTFRTKRK